jgi:hypothetical protein
MIERRSSRKIVKEKYLKNRYVLRHILNMEIPRWYLTEETNF